MKQKYIALLLCMGMLTGCSQIDKKEGWHCAALLHNVFSDTPYIIDLDHAIDQMKAMETYPLNLTEDYQLTGFFDQDVSLNPENCANPEDVNDLTYETAKYGDNWYFDLDDPENYISNLPADLMPDLIRITYSPKGNITVNEREAIVISFCYQKSKPGISDDGMAFVWYNGPDPTGGVWNWEEQKSEDEFSGKFTADD